MLSNLWRRYPWLVNESALVLTLALGIAGLAITDALVVQSRPDRAVVGEGQVVRVMAEHQEYGYSVAPAGPTVEGWKSELSTPQTITGVDTRQSILRQESTTESIEVLLVDPEFFELVPSPLANGRLFEIEEHASAAPVCMISQRLAGRFAGGDPVGHVLYVDREPLTVVGVLKRTFEVPLLPDLEVDLIRPFEAVDTESALTLVRIRTDRTAAALQEELEAFSMSSTEGGGEFAFKVLAASELEDSRQSQLIRFILLATCVLGLVTASNLINLLAVRGDRLREGTAVRWALGADRSMLAGWRVRRILVLGLVATLLACWLAQTGLRLFEMRLPPDLAYLAGGRLNLGSLALLAVVALVIALAFEVVPLRRLSAPKLRQDLTTDPRFGERPGLRKTLGQLQIVVLVALTVVMLVGMLLTLTSLGSLERVDSGFESADLHVLDLRLPELGYETPEQRWAFLHRFEQELSRLPEVGSVSLSAVSPLTGSVYLGEITTGTATVTGTSAAFVGAGFFDTTGLQLIAGRGFTPREVEAGLPVVVLSESLARELSGEPPAQLVNREVLVDGEPQRVVGVVGDLHLPAIDRPFGAKQAYWPFTRPRLTTSFVARASVDALGSQVEEIGRRLEPDAVLESATMSQLLRRSLAGTRFLAELLTALALATLALGALGVYVLLSLVASRRRPELALRTALGASRRALLYRVARTVLVPGLLGVVTGVVLSYPFIELIASRLFLADPPGFGTRLVAVVGLTIVLAGAAIPPLVSTLRVAPVELLKGR